MVKIASPFKILIIYDMQHEAEPVIKHIIQ